MNENRQYEFSVIVAIYNTEDYLRETIDSVLQQSIGFEDNVEILLVDDGSTDGSAAICQEYVQLYPRNIRYFYKDNGGAASSYNLGISKARGTYIAMLGSDDKYSERTLEEVRQFFSVHCDLNLVCIPLVFFEAKTGPHMLNNKFAGGTRVIDLVETPEFILLASGGTFIRRQTLIDEGLFLDPQLPIAEDATFIQQVLMLQMKYGVVAEGTYHYRKRAAGTSLLDTHSADAASFVNVLRNAWGFLFDKYRSSSDGVPRYLQYVVAYELQWRVKLQKSPLTPEEGTEYKAEIVRLLQDIDDEVILAQRFSPIQYKVLSLRLKYQDDVLAHAALDGTTYSYRGNNLFTFTANNINAQIYILDIDQGILTISGLFNGLRFNGLEHGFIINGEFSPVTYLENKLYEQTFLGDEVFNGNPFLYHLPIVPSIHIKPAVRLPNGLILEGMFNSYSASRLPGINTSYRLVDDLMLVNVRKREIHILSANRRNVLKHEIQFLGRMWLKEVFKPRDYSRMRLTYERLQAIAHHFKRSCRKIWLVSDRPDYASDNGEAFFRYAVDHCPENVDMYFLLSDRAPEYEELRKLGNIVDPRSARARQLFLKADKIISSQADDYVINPYARDGHLMRGLYHFDFVFLQHGITKDDQSAWLNKFSKNIKALVTSASSEWESMINGKYMYSQQDIVLTGMPRFDRIDNNPQKKIIIAPTWRNYLRGAFDPVKKEIAYSETFKDSSYFQFWQNLISDTRLNDALKEAGYVAEFWLHPSHFVQARDFQGTESVIVADPPHNYRRGFSEATVFVTDFSSAVFDYAYLKKPVVYTHFDIEEFKSHHIYKAGYFSYENDGFGPVCYDYDSTVSEIIRAISLEGKMPEEYAQRVDNFFAYHDRHNSQRVLEAILDIDARKA